MATEPMLNKFLRLKTKINLLKADIHFLKNCKIKKVFPNFMKIKCTVSNYRTEKAIESCKIRWLSEERKAMHGKLFNIELDLYNLHLKIPTLLDEKRIACKHYSTWIEFLHYTDIVVQKVVEKKIKRLNDKLRTLKNEKIEKRPKVQIVNDYVKNISSENFTDNEIKFLNKGLNFVPCPSRINTDELIVDIETAIKYAPDHVKSIVRKESKPIIRAARNTIFNNNNNHIKVLKSLKQKDVYYLKADKGNQLVIIDKLAYNQRMITTIEESNHISILKNPLPKMVKHTNSMINKISEIFKTPKWKLTISNPIVPRLYGLPKVHKPGEKMRPISSNINGPTHKLSSWINSKFTKITPPPPSLSIKNSIELAEMLKNIVLDDDEILVSFDVIALYPSIPMKSALEYIDEWLTESDLSDVEAEALSEATKLCMEQSEYQYGGKFYKLKDGTSMGNPLSCFIANTFMGKLETSLQKQNKLPRFWQRYVDDVIAIVKETEIENILDLLNVQYPTIKFTIEKENSYRKLPFLDLELTRNNNKIEINVYRKPTTTKRYITSDSFASPSHKIAAFNSMVYRLCILPLSIRDFKAELNYIKDVANINGFSHLEIERLVKNHSRKINIKRRTTLNLNSENNNKKRVKFNFGGKISNKLIPIFNKHNLDIVYSNNNKIKNILDSPKDKIDNFEKSGIYEIVCKCDKKYIGQTKRQIKTRFKEHISHIKYNRPTKSSVAEHIINSIDNNECDVNINNLHLIKHIGNKNYLDAWESLYINKYRTEIFNIDEEPIRSPLFIL